MAVDLTAQPTKRTAPPPRKAASKVTPRLTKKDERLRGLTGSLQVFSFAAVATKNYADAGALATHGPAFANELVNAAESSSAIASVVDFLTMTGPYTALIATGLPLVMQSPSLRGRPFIEATSRRPP